MNLMRARFVVGHCVALSDVSNSLMLANHSLFPRTVRSRSDVGKSFPPHCLNLTQPLAAPLMKFLMVAVESFRMVQ